MGIKRENNVGNFIIHFDVDFPEEFNKESRELLEKIL